MKQLQKRDPSLVQRFTDTRAIIAFRNLLNHGIVGVVHETVWDFLENKFPTLLMEVDAIRGVPR